MLILETDRLVLRRFTEADLPAFISYRGDPEVARFQSWSSYSREDAEEFFAKQKNLAFDTDGTWFQIALARKTDSELVGDIAVHFFDDARQAELGFTLAKRHQKQGLAVEALAAVVDLLFAKLHKHRLSATVDTRNVDAIRLLSRMSFRREAHHVKNILFKGEWSDEYGYALLNSRS